MKTPGSILILLPAGTGGWMERRRVGKLTHGLHQHDGPVPMQE